MIQFKRGSTENWLKQKKPLAAGQPGYDKNRNKIKIGDGERSWKDLPDASGLIKEEVFSSEIDAKSRRLKFKEGGTVITYGTDFPDEKTVGDVYLQCYDAEPEVDYVVDSGVSGIWTYQKWRSGIAKCSGTLKVSTAVTKAFESNSLFSNDSNISTVKYPFEFENTPSEVASLQTSGGLTWLASKKRNTKKESAAYSIISIDALTSNADFYITFDVTGFWR